jgi:predicted acyltransferase
VLGLFLAVFPLFHLSHIRIYGVLQRIALCYLACGLLYLWARRAANQAAFYIGLLVVLLVGYWALMRFVPVPGYGVPGRDIPFLDKDANIVAWLDRHMHLGRLWEKTRDPEGLLSTFPAIGTTLLGMLTALWLRTNRTLQRKCAGMLGAGLVLILLGQLWNPWFPINKKLWTSSFVLFMGGCSLVLWAFFMWLTEIKGWRKGTAFWLVFGMNAIASYAGDSCEPAYGAGLLDLSACVRADPSARRGIVAVLDRLRSGLLGADARAVSQKDLSEGLGRTLIAVIARQVEML